MLNSGKGLLVGIALLATVAAAYRWSPGLRTGLTARGNGWLGWTAAARQSDPVGFIGHVEKKLQTELANLQKCRQTLAGDLDQLQRKQREFAALRDQAGTAANEFRAEYQSARAGDTFPMFLRGAKYSEDEAIAQVSLLLAETEGFEATLARLQTLEQEAQAKREELVVRENATEGYLAGLGTQRELVRARGLARSGEDLIGQVDELLAANHLAVNQPVRSISELLRASDVPKGKSTTHLTAARQFLAATNSQRIESAPFKIRFQDESVSDEEVRQSPAQK